MERKKITFDSFIRGSIGCVLVVGILMLVVSIIFPRYGLFLDYQ